MKLALYSDDVMSTVDKKTYQPTGLIYTDRLVWAIIFDNIPADQVVAAGGVNRDGSATANAGTESYTWVDVVDAESGRALVGFGTSDESSG